MNVLSGDRIREPFAALDQELAKRAVVGEVLVEELLDAAESGRET